MGSTGAASILHVPSTTTVLSNACALFSVRCVRFRRDCIGAEEGYAACGGKMMMIEGKMGRGPLCASVGDSPTGCDDAVTGWEPKTCCDL